MSKKRDALLHQPCFSAVLTENILPVPLIERRSVIEVERWESSRTSGVLRGRQQHLQEVETDDGRSIASCCCYFKTGVSLSTRGHRGWESRARQHACPLDRGFNFSSAPLIRAAENQRPAESKQQTQSQFTFLDIPVIPSRAYMLQWLMFPILGGCLNITH